MLTTGCVICVLGQHHAVHRRMRSPLAPGPPVHLRSLHESPLPTPRRHVIAYRIPHHRCGSALRASVRPSFLKCLMASAAAVITAQGSLGCVTSPLPSTLPPNAVMLTQTLDGLHLLAHALSRTCKLLFVSLPLGRCWPCLSHQPAPYANPETSPAPYPL